MKIIKIVAEISQGIIYFNKLFKLCCVIFFVVVEEEEEKEICINNL